MRTLRLGIPGLLFAACLLPGCRGSSSSPTAPTTAAEAAVQRIALVPSPPTLPAGGGSTLISIATSGDKAGTVIAPNASVTLTATAGSLSAPVVRTDYTGHATVSWTGASTATIAASADGVTSTLVISVEAQPNPNPTPSPPPPPTTPGPQPSPTPDPFFVDVLATPRLTDLSTPVSFSTNCRGYNGSPAPTGLTYAWDFGDGETSTAVTPTHLFRRAADHYTVTVAVTSADGRTGHGGVDVVVGIVPAPTVTFTSVSSSTAAAIIGEAITFTATATGNPQAGTITGYAWEFGDGGTAGGASVSHTYTSAGAFTARVTATSSAGATAASTLPSITISLRPLFVNLSELQTSAAPSAGFTVTATISSLDPPAPGSIYEWDFHNDGTVDATTGTTNAASETVNGPVGTKQTIRVTVTAPDGRTATNTVTVTVS